MSDTPILKIENLGHAYGRYMVIWDISLEVAPGELTALIGPNGAGKTTFYNSVSGGFRPTAGKVYFDGRDITGLPVYASVRQGIGLVPEDRRIFPDLSVM